jgi:hypothetical protein
MGRSTAGDGNDRSLRHHGRPNHAVRFRGGKENMVKPLLTIQVGQWDDKSRWQATWLEGKKPTSYGIGRVGKTRTEAIHNLLDAMREQGYIKTEDFPE